MNKMRGESIGGGAPPAMSETNNNSAVAGSNATTGNAAFPTGPVFGAKSDDPLIKAETEKKVNEQKGALEVQYRQSIDEIDKHFEMRKK